LTKALVGERVHPFSCDSDVAVDMHRRQFSVPEALVDVRSAMLRSSGDWITVIIDRRIWVCRVQDSFCAARIEGLLRRPLASRLSDLATETDQLVVDSLALGCGRSSPESESEPSSSWQRKTPRYTVEHDPAKKGLDDVETDAVDSSNQGDDDEYISGMDTLNSDDALDGNLALIDVAIDAAGNNWDQATEAKVRNLANQLQRMPTDDEILKVINE